MADNKKASQYFMQLYKDVWSKYDAQAMTKYYHKKVHANTAGYEFTFDQFHQLLSNNHNHFAYMQPEYHRIVSAGEDSILAWFTTNHFNAEHKLVMRINTMGHYVIEDDKIKQIDFMWDQPVAKVMGYQQELMGSLTALLPEKLRELSLRELECFFHLIQGKTAKIIAEELHRSIRTIETHIRNIKSKLHLEHIRDIIEYAYELQLISLSPLFEKLYGATVNNEPTKN